MHRGGRTHSDYDFRAIIAAHMLLKILSRSPSLLSLSLSFGPDYARGNSPANGYEIKPLSLSHAGYTTRQGMGRIY